MEQKGEFPPSLFISGVRRIGDNPVGGGGFADIWRGRIDGKAGIMALKVLRMHDRSRGGQASLKVCHTYLFCLMAWSRTVMLAILQGSYDMEDVQA